MSDVYSRCGRNCGGSTPSVRVVSGNDLTVEALVSVYDYDKGYFAAFDLSEASDVRMRIIGMYSRVDGESVSVSGSKVSAQFPAGSYGIGAYGIEISFTGDGGKCRIFERNLFEVVRDSGDASLGTSAEGGTGEGMNISVDVRSKTLRVGKISGITDYNLLKNRPSIDGTTLEGEMTAHGLGLANQSDVSLVSADVKKLQAQISSLTSLIEVTYAELASLRSSGKLHPGKQYRITDFVTTSAQEGTRSAGHQFDIIVTADSETTLNENARAMRHRGDSYFASSKLEAWELKYCLDNDTNRFAWADAASGKGVIYWMRDEWDNECFYDFKSIQFMKKLTYGVLDEDNGTDTWVYTFNWYDDNNCLDASIVGNNGTLLNDDGQISGVHGNRIGFCRSYPENLQMTTLRLNDNVFLSTYGYNGGAFGGCYSNTLGNDCSHNTFGNDCYSNTLGNGCSHNTLGDDSRSNTLGDNCSHNTLWYGCYYNTFGDNCYSNTLWNDCDSNTFGDNCSYNTFGNDFCLNTLGNGCSHNTFGDNCSSNTLGNGCGHNTLGDDSRSNTLGNGCSSNTLWYGCSSNTFGDNCYYNTLWNDSSSNTFGDNCSSNTLGNGCARNTLGNGSYYNTFGDYYRYIILEIGAAYCTIANSETASYNNQVQNYTIKSSMRGKYNAIIGIPVSRNNQFDTTVAKNSRGEIKQYCEADLIQ